MQHVAIMKKDWNLTEMILKGSKKIESRWYKCKCVPWDKIKEGDTVYFKNTGDLVSIKADVEKVIQYNNLNAEKVMNILNAFGEDIGIKKEQIPYYFNKFKDKKYCILIFIKNAVEIEHFNISKKGYGTMAAWITIEDISLIKNNIS